MTTQAPAIAAPPRAETKLKGVIILLGRLLFVLIFLTSGPNYFKASTAQYAASEGVPLASVAVPVSGALAIIGSLSVLLGFYPRIGAWLLVLFLVPVTFMMHKFWTISDPNAAQMQMIMFMKNLSMIGGALIISQLGTGPFSLDGVRSR